MGMRNGGRGVSFAEETPPRGDKERTQARILQAARETFARRGYDRTSIAMIAARAGVSRAAVFWHFGSKQGLFEQVCREMMRPFLDQLATSLGESDPRSRLFALFGAYEDFVERHAETIRTVMRWVLESARLRAELGPRLLALHESFARDLRETVQQLVGDAQRAAALSAGLLSLLDGNLLLSLVDPGPAAEARRTGLHALAHLVIEECARIENELPENAGCLPAEEG